MERERQVVRQVNPGGGGAGSGGGLDDLGGEVRGLLDAADRILDAIRPLNAEDYLQQNRQRGGQ